jgi:hypothetical protein
MQRMGGRRAEGSHEHYFHVLIISCADAADQGTHKGVIDVCRNTREMYCLQQNYTSNGEGMHFFSPLSLPPLSPHVIHSQRVEAEP